MCGIFGFIATPTSTFEASQLPKLLERLFLLSESRGKDSSGVVLANEQRIQVFKRPQRARDLIRSAQYHQELVHYQQAPPSSLFVMGHARMVTNGSKEYHVNNQPVIKDGMTMIHNGIIVNDAALWDDFPQLDRQYQVDTEVLLALIRHYRNEGCTLNQAVISALGHTQGANSIALLADDADGLILATTNGSIYWARSQSGNELVFGSEEYIVQQAILHDSIAPLFASSQIVHVLPDEGYSINFADALPHHFSLQGVSDHALNTLPARKINDVVDGSATDILPPQDEIRTLNVPNITYPVNDAFIAQVNRDVEGLRRCSRCVLPETFPFITFDADGVCNYCHNYKPIQLKGRAALDELVAPHRRTNGKPDVLVPFSGGRDSSYSVHYIKRELGMNPVAYTYDWGLVTDLARRNISRMCGILGIEHILISANIKKKRDNVRKNVQAWLKKPRLGTIPLFMAGDKQFFYFSNMLKRQMDIPQVLFGMNPLERTDFKVGFCGIDNTKQSQFWTLNVQSQLKMLAYYGKEFLTNPAYLNSSLVDSMGAFASYYLIDKDYDILYDYILWEENEVEQTLINEYDWELATDTESTWRIGDGTASFYNYIYYTVAGFSENDTFRSNQIREGMLDRDAALAFIQRDNQPRYDSIRWYADVIGFDFEAAIKRINAIPKLYA
jgi:glucosamine--fructose-6-phosphate aminotransferase (isomerizing)